MMVSVLWKMNVHLYKILIFAISLLSVSNKYLFEKVCICNVIIILDKFYRLVSHKHYFGHSKSNFSNIYQNKNAPDECEHIVFRIIRGND